MRSIPTAKYFKSTNQPTHFSLATASLLAEKNSALAATRCGAHPSLCWCANAAVFEARSVCDVNHSTVELPCASLAALNSVGQSGLENQGPCSYLVLAKGRIVVMHLNPKKRGEYAGPKIEQTDGLHHCSCRLSSSHLCAKSGSSRARSRSRCSSYFLGSLKTERQDQ